MPPKRFPKIDPSLLAVNEAPPFNTPEPVDDDTYQVPVPPGPEDAPQTSSASVASPRTITKSKLRELYTQQKAKYPDIDKDGFATEIANHGFQIVDDAPVAAPSEGPTDTVKDLKGLLLGNGLGSPLTMAGIGMSGLEGAAKVGRMGAELVKAGGRAVGGKTEKVANLGSELIPQSKLGVALAGATMGEGPGTDLVEQGARKVTVPKAGTLSKVGGGILSAFNRVDRRFTTAWLSDPELLNEATPGVKEVSKEMGQYFADKGTKLNSEMFKKMTRQDWFPNESQVAKLQDIVRPVIDKIKSGAKVSEEEIIFAERASNAITRSTQAQSNHSMMSVARGQQTVLLDQLEKHGFSELPDLKAKYFRALAKDAAQNILPMNKQGSPNALSTMLMGKLGMDAVEQLGQGEVSKALGKAAQAAVFSPYLGAGVIKAGNNVLTSNVTKQTARGLTVAGLNQIGKKERNNDDKSKAK